MMYIAEKVPLPEHGRGRRASPITAQMRKLAVGESFLVPYNDPNWTGNHVRNENTKKKACYITVR